MQVQKSIMSRMRCWPARAASDQFIAAFVGGSLVGLLTASLALHWILTWGHDSEFVSAGYLLFGVGLFVGRITTIGRDWHWSQLAVLACCWGLLQPVILHGLTTSLSLLSVSLLESAVLRSMLAIVCASTTWVFTGLCVSRIVDSAGRDARFSGKSLAPITTSVFLGIGFGLALNTFALAPVFGIWWAMVIGLIVSLACWWQFVGHNPLSNFANSFLTQNHADDRFRLSHATPAAACEKRISQDNSAFLMPCRLTTLFQALAAFFLGGMFAVTTHLVGQLMPDSYQLGCTEWWGLIGGISLTVWHAGRRPSNPISVRWSWLFAAAWNALLLAAFPAMIDASLWINSTFTWVVPLLMIRSAIVFIAAIPLGIAFGSLVADVSHKNKLGSGLPFLCGLVVLNRGSEVLSLAGLMTACGAAMVLLTFVEQRPRHRSLLSWRMAGAMFGLALWGLSVPLWQANNDPARVSKLLFSTPAFLAHRSGWESRLLPLLDDSRMISQQVGSRGPLTLWRSKGLELHLRENGIPRSVISINTDVYPQFAPEVLLAALPLVLADQPSRVLILGASSGVTLSASLQFPVKEAVCVEGNAGLIRLLKGHIVDETSSDPLSDERVRLISAPPELMLMTHQEPFDVILSSPPSSAVLAGGASFTSEYYRRASKCLKSRGIFCQRFECLDFGPGPLRLVLQSLRQSFCETIAVETATGELLLMATNTSGVFIPDNLPARLETPHVRRLLARSGFDWSVLLNLPAYDHAALGEICDEAHAEANSVTNGRLAFQAPLEILRWGKKLLDTQQVLTKTRTTPARFSKQDRGSQSTFLANQPQVSRKSRFLEWLGESHVSAELLRRLSEVATRQKLVREFPESHWWEYRKALRQQLQDHPRSAIQQVRHVRGEAQTHPEDQTRRNYFVALGEAAQRAKPTVEQIAAIEACFEPYDPFISYFGRQEVADLEARSEIPVGSELSHRLHVIYFAPEGEASTRNVTAAINLLVKHPEAIGNAAQRFDILNGLVQLLRVRWETRQGIPMLSVRRQLTDVDKSVIAAENAMSAMENLVPAVSLPTEDWSARKQVVDKILLRPLRAYREELQASAKESQNRTRALLEQATDVNPKL